MFIIRLHQQISWGGWAYIRQVVRTYVCTSAHSFPGHNFVVCCWIKILCGTNDRHNKTMCRYLQGVGHRATLKQIRYRSINLLFMVDLALIVIFRGPFTSSTNILVSFTYCILQHMEFSIKTISQTIYWMFFYWRTLVFSTSEFLKLYLAGNSINIMGVKWFI